MFLCAFIEEYPAGTDYIQSSCVDCKTLSLR